jgi:hypothetical protein
MLRKTPMEPGNEDSTDTVVSIKQVGRQLLSGCHRIANKASLHYQVSMHYPLTVTSLSPEFKFRSRPLIYNTRASQSPVENCFCP